MSYRPPPGQATYHVYIGGVGFARPHYSFNLDGSRGLRFDESGVLLIFPPDRSLFLPFPAWRHGLPMTSSSFAHLDRLVARLPFPLDATDEVNAAFERWQTEGSPEDEMAVALWTYCFVMRYFLVKSVYGSIQHAADVDALVAKVYRKIERKRTSVEEASRYASWVSVICKNTFLNYVQRRPTEQSIQEKDGPVLVAEPAQAHDAGFVMEALDEAIDRLPPYLQETARLYFLKGYSYAEISDAIDRPVPTVRSYRHKIVQRFREDDRLLAVLPTENQEGLS